MAGQQTTRVSVVIATYNRAALVQRAIRSVFSQSHPDIELIVVDDGSTDHTPDVLARLSPPRSVSVRCFRKDNGGCASARNYGARNASGKWLMFLDSDDELVTGALERLVTAAERVDADFVYSPAVEVDSRGRQSINTPVAAGRPEQLAVEHFCWTNVRTGSYVLLRSVFLQLGGFNESYSHNEDSDFVQRMAIEARGAYSPEASVRVYVHPGGKSRDRIAIHRALLTSSEAVLQRYPVFAQTLGVRAGDRIRDLQLGLVNALILAGRLDDAARLAELNRWRIPPVARLSLLFRTSIPARVHAMLRQLAHATVTRTRTRLRV